MTNTSSAVYCNPDCETILGIHMSCKQG